MKYYFLTLFPGLIHQYFGDSMMKRAVDSGVVDYEVIDIRDYSGNKHKKVDDYPYGGGAGMVMAAPPIAAALKSIEGGALSGYPPEPRRQELHPAGGRGPVRGRGADLYLRPLRGH